MYGETDMSVSTQAPLLGGSLGQRFGWHQGVLVSRGQFLARVETLADELPEHPYAINLCEDRLSFAVSFCALLLRGQINLLPPNRTSKVIQEIGALHEDHYLIGEGRRADVPGRWVEVCSSRVPMPRAHARAIPEIATTARAAITFTSGSTGKPRSYHKEWGKLVFAARNLARHVHRIHGAISGIVATVPPQHMYGLETSVLLPLHGGIPVHGGHPLYPRDVHDALEASGDSPMLITTPVHIRALVNAGSRMPRCALVMSATAPLDAELACAAESLFRCEVREIYGSTETGVVAGRRTVDGPLWTAFDGVRIYAGQDWRAHVQTGHLDEAMALGDHVQMHEGGRFELLGRDADMLNIAGKRASLADLNRRLLAVPGVLDGVFLMPEDVAPGGRANRLGALVVAPRLDRTKLLEALRESVDPAFLPRRVVFLDRLPRDAVGKLPRAALLDAWNPQSVRD